MVVENYTEWAVKIMHLCRSQELGLYNSSCFHSEGQELDYAVERRYIRG